MNKGPSRVRLAKAMARLAVPLASAQYWALLPVAAAEGLALFLEARGESTTRKLLAGLPASISSAYPERLALPQDVQTKLQSLAAGLVELVRREIARLGLLDLPDAETAQEVLTAFPERIAGTVAELIADTSTFTPRKLAQALATDLTALLSPILRDGAQPIAEHLASAIVVALAEDPVLRGPFDEAHREETRELARSVQLALDKIGELDKRLLQLDELVARAAGIPSSAMLAELVRWSKSRMLDENRRRLRAQLTRPLDEWTVRDMLEAEGLGRSSPETPRAYAYVPHCIESWYPHGRDAEGEGRGLSKTVVEALRDKMKPSYTKGSSVAAKGQSLSKEVLELLLSLDDTPATVLVQALAGFGKSTFLRWLAVQWNAEDSAPLPVLVTIKELADAGYDLATALLGRLSFPDYWSPDQRLGLVERGLAVVLVDGLDQIQGAPEGVRDAVVRAGRARVVAACREELGPGAGLADWSALVRLRHLDPRAFTELVDKNVRMALEGALDGNDVRHPFFLHVARTIMYTGSRGLPRRATKIELLDCYIRRLLQHGEDRKCGLEKTLPRGARLDPDDWQLDVLGTLGLESLRWLHGTGEATDQLQATDGEVWKYARQRAGERHPNRLEQVERFLDAARDRSHLVYLLEYTRTGTAATYRFHHQLLQEYLAALGIALRVEASGTAVETLAKLAADVVSPGRIGSDEGRNPVTSRVLGLRLWSMLGELLAVRDQGFAERLVFGISTWLLDESPAVVEPGSFRSLELSPLLDVRGALVETMDRSESFHCARPAEPDDPVVAQFAEHGVPYDPFMALCWEDERRRIREQVASVADWLLHKEGASRQMDEVIRGRLQVTCTAGDVEARIQALAPALRSLLSAQGEESLDVGPFGPTLAAWDTGVVESAGPHWILIPHGPFVAGDVEYSDELPVRVEQQIESPFWIGFDPVTVEGFAHFLDEQDGTYNLTEAWWQAFDDDELLWTLGGKIQPSAWDKQKESPGRPVFAVSWLEAAAYCRWRNGVTGEVHGWGGPYRLPTEAEWEKATRGVLGRSWPWGCAWRAELALCCEKGSPKGRPAEVQATRNMSPFGVRGAVANAWEWTARPWKERESGGPALMCGVQGMHASSLRGGSFLNSRWGIRCAYRRQDSAGYGNINFGFRASREVIW